MSEALQIVVPLLNPNEPEAQLNAVHVENGQYIEPGEVLFTLETTKSVNDLAAEDAGYIAGLKHLPGEMIRAGETLCWIANTPDWQPVETSVARTPTNGDLPAGLRISEPARQRAEHLGLDLSSLPVGPFITEAMVEEHVFTDDMVGAEIPEEDFDPRAIIVYGGGGHGRSVIDLLRVLDTYEITGVIDDGMSSGEEIMGVPVLGGGDQLPALSEQGIRLAVNAVGGIGDVRSRVRIFQRLIHAGFGFPLIVHPSAVVEASAVLEAGSQVFPQAYVGSKTVIGFGSIVNTGAVVSHNCRIESAVNIAPGALIAGGVTIGASVLVGMGVTVNLGVKIGSGARIGNSAVVKADVPADQIIRAGAIWPEFHES